MLGVFVFLDARLYVKVASKLQSRWLPDWAELCVTEIKSGTQQIALRMLQDGVPRQDTHMLIQLSQAELQILK